MAISSALTTALQGLLVQQTGLNVVGHNIANANTPGYSRQRAELNPALPDYMPYGAIGRGVEVRGIERVVNEFLLTQQRDAISRAESDNLLSSVYSRMEVIFNELSENDMSTAFDRFYNALQDLSVNVEADATRGLVLQQALALRDLVGVAYNAMRDFHTQLNNDVTKQVEKVNELVDEIADLNRQISVSEGGGALTANDLRDIRDQKLAELSEMVDITTIEQTNGAMNVVTLGMPLVMLTHPFHLETVQTVNANGLAVMEVRFIDGGSPLMATYGTLPATIQARDQVLSSYLDDLNQFTADMIFEMNRIHSQGVGLTPLSSVTSEHAAIDTTVSLDQINLGFTAQPGTFQIVNGSLTVAIVNLNSGLTNEINVPIDLDGINGDDDSLADFVANFNAAVNAAVPGGTVQASIDAAGHLRFSALDPAAYGFYFSQDTSGLLATMGVNTFWSGHDASTLDVNPDLLADERLLAASKSLSPGDNTNLLDMLAMRDQDVADGDTKTIEEFYRSIIGRLGTEALRTNSRLAVRSDMVLRLENERQSVSGVSLDEEMTKMIQFQRAYQAAARVIVVADSMIETLINRT